MTEGEFMKRLIPLAEKADELVRQLALEYGNWKEDEVYDDYVVAVKSLVDEAKKDLPKIYIDSEGWVSLRDNDYNHDIVLGKMQEDALKNIEEAKRSIAKFKKWFGDSEEVAKEK